MLWKLFPLLVVDIFVIRTQVVPRFRDLAMFCVYMKFTAVFLLHPIL